MDRGTAHHRAFRLLEAVQGDGADDAVEEIAGLLRRADDWPEVSFVLHAALVIHAIVRADEAGDVLGLVAQLQQRAPEPAAEAMALGLKALVQAGSGDTPGLLADVCRAVALLDDDGLPALERCVAWVICGAALNTLRLWELVDELYTLALSLGPAAAAAGQSGAVAVNRVVIRLEHGLALLEAGEAAPARVRLQEALDAVEPALAEDLTPLWTHNVLAAADVARLLLRQPLATPMTVHRAALVSCQDVEVLPHLDAVVALMAWEDGGDPEPARALNNPVSTSSGARTFPLWVRAKVLAGSTPSEAVLAQREHAELVGALLWQSRAGVLSSARAQLATERRRAEHERLAHAVHTDPLTGLHNRRRFDDWLERGVSSGTAGLLLLDLDHFKDINDAYGHAVGDDVLRRVGFLLRASIRPGDVAVRQGGDEFAVLLSSSGLSDVAVLERAQAIARTVQQEDWSSVALGLRVDVSVGAALGSAGPALYEAADRALYAAKVAGTGPVLADPERLTGADR